MTNKITKFYTKLQNRAIITLSGEDRKPFLQNLITNDINLLEQQSYVYACLLTPQGKFLYDFFISETPETLVLDCEGGERLTSLLKMLNMYKLRAAVTLEGNDNIPIYAIINDTSHGHKDPRHKDIGNRSFAKPDNLPEQSFDLWDRLRISLCIPDGSRDLIPNKSTMDEGRLDQLAAISYDKGCYIGQELTARMHYRGLGKKHLQTVKTDQIPDKAELRSSCGDIGIALVRDV